MLNCKRSNIYLIFSLDSNKSEQSLTVSRFLKLNRHKTFTLHRFLGIPCIYRGGSEDEWCQFTLQPNSLKRNLSLNPSIIEA